MSFFSPKDSTPRAPSKTRQERGRAARNSGYEAEDAAVNYLQKDGVTILARNMRNKSGEIDIIGSDRGTLIFIEVRQRKHIAFGGAAESVTFAKQRRVINAARFYLLQHPHLANLPCRLDCIFINGSGNIEWLCDAYRLD